MFHKQKEFEEARKDLQIELDKGASLDEIRKKTVKGEVQTKVSKQLQNKRVFTIEKTQRKKRDYMHLLNKYGTESVKDNLSVRPKAPTTVELLMKAKEQDAGPILNKSIFKLGDKELMVSWSCVYGVSFFKKILHQEFFLF